MKQAIAILAGGGPAPGINTVVASIAKTFLQKGYRVIGLHGGFSSLFTKNRKTTEFTPELAEMILTRGGSYLLMSRFKPSDKHFDEDFDIDFFTDNNISLLVSIGGDDTASTANRVAKFLSRSEYKMANIHVPKTIDNDLPLPAGCPTFGYQSAKAKGAEIASIVYSDAKTSGNWFVVCAMGRSAGHLAFSMGSGAHYPMIVVPEMFNKAKITVDKIVNLVISSIIKRRILGISHGATMISEGVFHELSEEEITKTGIVFSYDEHGHPELGKVSKAQVFNQMIENKIKQLGLKVKTRPVEIGYEVRCAAPNAYDLVYCSLMGMGVYKLFSEGKTGCMVYVEPTGQVNHLMLNEIQDPITGKIPPRLLDITGDKVVLMMENIFDYIEQEDYDAAKEYVENPEDYDFKKILNW